MLPKPHIFIGKNFSLPNRFLVPEYDKFLFFDFGLGLEFDFLHDFSALIKEINPSCKIDVFDFAFNPIINNGKLSEDSLLDIIKKLNNHVDNFGFNGVIFADSELNWVAIQSLPVTWGVFAFKSSSVESLKLFNKINRDWFVELDVNQGQHQEALIDEFGEEFLNTLLENYFS